MPWCQKSMKDVASCEKLRGAANKLRPEDVRMGQPTSSHVEVSAAEYIGGRKTTQGSEPSQYLQEQKTKVIPLVAASARGRAQTNVLARWGCRAYQAVRPASQKPRE